ncbi:MAG: hypothetical protein AABW79_02205 [Nanoarchaeota archaeon]
MEVNSESALTVLRDTVVYALGGNQFGSPFATVFSYLSMAEDDVDAETVKKLRGEFAELEKVLSTTTPILRDGDRNVRVESIGKPIVLSDPVASLVLRSGTLEESYSPGKRLQEIVTLGTSQCDLAISRNCGFSKYTRGHKTST